MIKRKIIAGQITFVVLLFFSIISCVPEDDEPKDGQETKSKEQILEFISTNYSYCERYITDSNPSVCNGIIRFNCGMEVDGPLFFFNAFNFNVISICGGTCLAPDEKQAVTCLTMCPPKDYQCS